MLVLEILRRSRLTFREKFGLIIPRIAAVGRNAARRDHDGHIHRRVVVFLAVLVMIAGGGRRVACQETRALPSATKDTPEAHLGKGYDALREDRYEVAASEFQAALKLDPKLVLRARFPLAVALFELHKPDESRRELEAVRREVGDHPNVVYYLGRLDLEDRNFEAAIRNLNKAIAQPPFPDAAYYLGFAYFKQGDLASAERWLKEAAQQLPQDARIQYQLGMVYRKQGREEDAKKVLALSEEQRQRDANESKLRLECAQKLDQVSREEAHAVCEKLYDAGNAEKLTALGTIYAQHGDLEAALKPLRRAAELAPQSPQMQYNLALAYYQLNRFEEARVPLANTLPRWPDLFQLNALYGAVLSKLREDLPAYQALRHAHELNSSDSATADQLYLTTLGLARKARDTWQYSDSLRYFQEASELRPQEPEPHRGMAEIYTLTGRSVRAKAEQQQAERLTQSLGKPQ
jgi:tetratricopeptide (TPR) repeat protein